MFAWYCFILFLNNLDYESLVRYIYEKHLLQFCGWTLYSVVPFDEHNFLNSIEYAASKSPFMLSGLSILVKESLLPPSS